MMRYYNQSPIENISVFFKQKSLLSKLILINVIVFLFVNIISLFAFLFNIQTQGISPVTQNHGL